MTRLGGTGMKVGVTYSDNRPVSAVEFEHIESILSAHELVRVRLPDRDGGVGADVADILIDAIADCDALIHRFGRIDAAVLDACPNLEFICLLTSGSDHVDLDAATERGVIVTNCADAHATTVSEASIALMFATIRAIPAQSELVADGEWDAARALVGYDGIPLVSNATIGVVGVGTIGFKVARKLHRLGATVVGYDPYLSDRYRAAVTEIGIDLVESLEVLLEQADIVTLHTPLNDETRGLIGADELALLEGGYLINAARGPVVDEAALIDALEAGTIAGAGLDVLEQEPPAPDNPLLALDTVVMTPHTSGSGQRSVAELPGRVAAENVRRYGAGKRPHRVLNPSVTEYELAAD